jgi:Fe-S-cluster-containing hydrogenase component 2
MAADCACAEGAIQIIDGKARVVDDSFCDGLGACLGDCPQGAITIIEREAPAFDEEAVGIHLAGIAKKEALTPAPAPKSRVCGCPKLDDIQHYREKLEAIFKEAEPKSVMVLRMEVPCCTGIAMIAKEAVDAVEKDIRFDSKVIGIQGDIREDPNL